MIWPFLMIYVSKKLQTPLTTTASLMTINAGMGLIASFIAGPVIDRFGRKWIMAFSLGANGLAYLFLSHAGSLPAFAVLMGLSGAVNPIYRVGADAMMADLVAPEKRIDAYSLMRLSNNLGVALGPAIGGFIAASSYTLAFYFAAAGMVTYGLLLALFAYETLPVLQTGDPVAIPNKERYGGYLSILKDIPFMSFVISFTMVAISAAMLWVLLGVYTNQHYQIPENLFGLIPATNAIMIVFFQMPVTRITKRYPPLLTMAVGSLFYAIAVGSVALGRGFWYFWFSMIVLTIGELILMPTSSTYAANLAPVDKRGRYMAIYGLAWGIAIGIGPLFGGLLNDNFGPKAIWVGGALTGVVSVLGFLLLGKYPKKRVS